MGDELLKVVFVDDEFLLRNLLRNCIKWGDIGIEVAGEAENAQEALRLIDEVIPDIVFVDINIPVINGIELSRAIIGKYPHIKIIILTGYEEFEYAMAGIKIGIADFLTKPVIPGEIKEAVIKVKEKLEFERSRKSEFDRLKKQMDESSLNDESLLNTEGRVFDANETDIIKLVQDYLYQNMSDFELSLQKVAGAFYINQSYLSRLFKKKTGVNFVEYLVGIRIQKAIELLKETDMKVYRIAEEVGIIDPHYLGVCFKRKTGMSMSEYKRKRSG